MVTEVTGLLLAGCAVSGRPTSTLNPQTEVDLREVIPVGSSVQLTLHDGKVIKGIVTQVLATDLMVGDHWHALENMRECKYGFNGDYDDVGRAAMGVLIVGFAFMIWFLSSLGYSGG